MLLIPETIERRDTKQQLSGASRLIPLRTPDSRGNSENPVVCRVKPATHSLNKEEQSCKIQGESSLALPTLLSSWEMSAKQRYVHPSVIGHQCSEKRCSILAFNMNTSQKKIAC